MGSSMSIELDQKELLEKADRYLVGGCLGMFHLPPEVAMVFVRGAGSRIYDASGREYIDYVMGSGPMILGHAHPRVVDAVGRQVSLGSTFYTLNPHVIRLAERIVDAVPCGETIRFMSSGTEATFYALRLARAFTGRDRVLKFEGGWHGGHDYAQQSATPSEPGGYPKPQPDSAGIPEPVSEQVLVAPFNDAEVARTLIEAHREELAAVIVEPLQRAIPPKPGFLQRVREITERHGILLIFDEVVTGFRLAWGGAQERYGVVPDLAAYGKTISGGYPMATVCGRRDVMDLADPHRKRMGKPWAFFSGTFNGNPVGCAAGLATLDELERPGTYERLYEIGDRLRRGIERIAGDRDVPAHVVGEGPVLQVFFTDHEVVDWRSSLAADAERAYRLGVELIKRGLFVTPGGKLYLSLAHTDEDLSRTLEVFEDTFRAISDLGSWVSDSSIRNPQSAIRNPEV